MIKNEDIFNLLFYFFLGIEMFFKDVILCYLLLFCLLCRDVKCLIRGKF